MMNLRSILGSFMVLFCALVLLGACKSSGKDGYATTASMEKHDAIPYTIPSSSLFSKISLGWSQARVHDTIGKPTDSRGYVTGKNWIPMYFGSDRYRFEDLYKGEGRIIYSGGAGMSSQGYTVLKIIYDPNESGYNDKTR
jgi:hypothetical protein